MDDEKKLSERGIYGRPSWHSFVEEEAGKEDLAFPDHLNGELFNKVYQRDTRIDPQTAMLGKQQIARIKSELDARKAARENP